MTSAVPARRCLFATVVFLVALTLALAGCGDKKDEGQTKKSQDSSQSSQSSQASSSSTARGKQAAEAAKAPAPEIKVVKAESVNAPLLKEYSASIEAKESVDIRARVAGYLEKRLFTEGSMVTKGQPLFKIEPSEYEQALKQAQSQLARDKATLDKARTDVQRFGDLYKKGAISREEYDTRVTTFKEYEATVAQDEAAVKQAQLNLSYTDITAPVAGRIGRAQAQVGDLVGHGENTLLVTITTVDPVYVNFSISEQDYLSYVKEAQERKTESKGAPKVELLLKLSDDTVYMHPGKINMVDPTVDQKTGTLGIRATFPNPDGLLLPGQFARVMLAVERDSEVILLPQRAVMDVQGMKMCLTVGENNVLQSKSIQLGQELGSFVVVEKGLEAGELVAVEGQQKVKAGDAIQPKVTEMNLKPLLQQFSQVVDGGGTGAGDGDDAALEPAPETQAPAAPATEGGAQQ